MKVLLFGKNGQLARRIYYNLLPLAEIVRIGSEDLNFLDTHKVKKFINSQNPSIIVNAAAYTKVDSAEQNEDLAFQINSEAVRVIAEEAEKIGAWLIHFSTNYVFDGKQDSPYKETDRTSPVNIYGKSKELGDRNVILNCSKFIILRISAIFDVYGNNFPKAILFNAKHKENLKVVCDQMCTPTSSQAIASIVVYILYKIQQSEQKQNYVGLYNAFPNGAISWYEFARYLVECAQEHGVQLKCTPEKIIPILSKDYPVNIERPFYAEFDNSKLYKVFGLEVPNWKFYIPNLLTELKLMKLL